MPFLRYFKRSLVLCLLEFAAAFLAAILLDGDDSALVLMMISLVFICFDADLYDWVKYLSIGYGGYMLYILLKDGTHGPNQYGEDPLQRIR